MKLKINFNKFRKMEIDNREFTSECVPISDTMEIKMRIRDAVRELKYKIKHIGR